jgi:hypothetical protein
VSAPEPRPPNGHELTRLLGEFESLTRQARSVFPGRVLFPRRRAEDLLGRMRNEFDPAAVSTAADLGEFTPAFLAIDALEHAVIRGSTGPSIWRIWFADFSRTRLSALATDLREALAAYSEDRSVAR